jgi:hypothetical protein
VQVGVFVLGMHRSGTSAVTRLVSLHGLATPPDHDLVQPTEKNPKGYWESEALVNFTERLLRAIDCDMGSPRTLADGWEGDPRLAELRAEAPAAVAGVFPRAPWVWKDPRLCLTLRFWRETLDVKPVVVFVNRHPLEITASTLRIRSEGGKVYALALWERYVREALKQAAGLPLLAVNYADVLAAPLGWCRKAQAFLVSEGVPGHEPREADVLEFIDRDLRHAHFDADDLAADDEVSVAQRELFAALEGLEGVHEAFTPPSLPKETPTTEALLAERRRALQIKNELTRELQRRADWRGRIRGRVLRALPGR